MESSSSINFIFHGAVFALAFFTLLGSLVSWYLKAKKGEGVKNYWKLFVFGLLFYSISEFADLFTPNLRASIGIHNYLTELSLLVGLSFIVISLRRLFTA